MDIYIKGAIFAILLIAGVVSASAQQYFDGEELYYRAAYFAKLVPNTDVGEVTVTTKVETFEGKEVYRVTGNGRTLPFFRWFFDMNDTYNIWVDKRTLLTQRF